MAHRIFFGAFIIGFILTIVHFYYKHVLIDNPAPELLIAILFLAIPLVLIMLKAVKVSR